MSGPAQRRVNFWWIPGWIFVSCPGNFATKKIIFGFFWLGAKARRKGAAIQRRIPWRIGRAKKRARRGWIFQAFFLREIADEKRTEKSTQLPRRNPRRVQRRNPRRGPRGMGARGWHILGGGYEAGAVCDVRFLRKNGKSTLVFKKKSAQYYSRAAWGDKCMFNEWIVNECI